MNPKDKKLLNFIIEIEKLKYIKRQILVNNGKRQENDVEHSWHLSMMVWLFAKSFEKKINLEKAIKMALIHDLVEIYAGDVSAFDEVGRRNKKQNEKKAAKRLLKQLPEEFKIEFSQLWNEYELKESHESQFVQGLDKLHPLIQNVLSNGISWKKDKITQQMVWDYKIVHTQNSHFLKNTLIYLMNKAKRGGMFFK